MPLFDHLAKAAKDFFVEEGEGQPAPAPAARSLPYPAAAAAAGANPATYSAAAPVVTQAEQRHLDHISGLLAGDGKDFVAFVKMVKSMAASGLAGPVLYQTAFNAFSAMTGVDLPTLLASAEQFEMRLAADRNKVLERHQEKLGEIRIPNAAPGPIVQLLDQEQQLQQDLTELSRQLEDKRQLLLTTQQQLQQERHKAQTSLASYELASATAAADLHAHRQAAGSFLTR